MQQIQANRKVVGATLIGGGMVLAAFLINNLSSNLSATSAPTAPLQQIAVELPKRDFIPVIDTNDDGVEDWREEFVIQAPIDLPATGTAATFEMPTTVTDQVGIQLFESLLKNKTNSQPTMSTADMVTKTTSKIEGLVSDTLYTMRDVTTVPTEPVAIRRYGNMMGQSLIANNVPGSEGELEIMYSALQTNNVEELKKLEPLANMYLKLRDDALNTPVPDRFKENHLNLINVYHTMYRDISEFQKIFDDPMVALLRIKRYQDDATALATVLNNTYRSAAPYAALFEPGDPALVFIAFSN